MSVRWETTTVNGHPMRIYLATPDKPGSHPTLLVAQHGGGLDAPMQDVVHRLHRAGYTVALPELYHRQAADVDPTKRSSLLKDDEIITDLQATLAHVRATTATGPVGILGFCMGGRVAYLAASALPGLSAAVVFYGGNLFKALGNGPSPFERSMDIGCPILGFFGAEDPNPSRADVRRVDDELTRLGKSHEFHTFQDAGHAFHNFLMPERYRDRPMRSSWTTMLDWLREKMNRDTPS